MCRQSTFGDVGPRRDRETNSEHRTEGTTEGKMKGVVLLVSEKHVCTGFATALAD